MNRPTRPWHRDQPHEPGVPDSAHPGPRRPGWSEIAAAAVAYVALVAVGTAVILQVTTVGSVLGGLGFAALSALAGLGAFAAAFAIRIRDWSAFGVRRVSWRWLLLGAGLGVAAWLLGRVLVMGYIALTGDTGDPQSVYDAAAGGGTAVVTSYLLLIAVATPVGEELAFRGVLTNALNRYGPWVGVGGSTVVFTLAHGISVVMPVAFVVGLIAALLVRRTGSVWPGVLVHAVNNALGNLVPMLLSSITG
ncbi:MAG: CPBP family intramembrane metalloprotease [Streptosporangiales bacterium]|nr:CPBP family intramembrane metalloprotease [Streptosporangiales bacterium]